MITIRSAALAAALALGGCASTQPSSPPAATLASRMLAFEHFDSREVMAIAAELERRHGVSIDAAEGASGRMQLAVTSSRGAFDMLRTVSSGLSALGYNLDDLQITSRSDGSVIVDRIVDTGFRPSR